MRTFSRPTTTPSVPVGRISVVLLVLALVGCSGTSATAVPASTPIPTSEATTTTTTAPRPDTPPPDFAAITPEAAGFDAAKLDSIKIDAEVAGSNCFLVLRDGHVVSESYWRGGGQSKPQEVWSMSKSFTSALVGLAQSNGKLSIDDRASKYISEWRDGPSDTVTVKNLLSADSGRYWDYGTDYLKMAAGAADKTAFSIALDQQSPPGTNWVYNNAAVQTLSRVLSDTTGVEPGDYAVDQLFRPLGMADTSIKSDPSGHSLTFMGVQSTCRDAARFGALFMAHGRSGSTQILPESYVSQSLSPSQELNKGYGYLWWLNTPGLTGGNQRATAGASATTTTPSTTVPGAVATDTHRQMAPGAPEDMFWALGLGDQILQMDPGSNTIVVRLGPAGSSPGTTKFRQTDAARVVTEALLSPGHETSPSR